MKSTIFQNYDPTNIIISEPDITSEKCTTSKHVHTTTTSQYVSLKKKKITHTTLHEIHSSKRTLQHHMHTKLAQLRAKKSLLLQNYLLTLNTGTSMSQFPLCLTHLRNTIYCFNSSQVLTQHHTNSLWKKPFEAADIIQEGELRLVSLRI